MISELIKTYDTITLNREKESKVSVILIKGNVWNKILVHEKALEDREGFLELIEKVETE